MKLKLLRNLAGPHGENGFEGDVVCSPPMPADLAAEMLRRGLAVEVPDTEPAPPAAHDVTVKNG